MRPAFVSEIKKLAVMVSFFAKLQPVQIILPGNVRFFKKFSQEFMSFELGGGLNSFNRIVFGRFECFEFAWFTKLVQNYDMFMSQDSQCSHGANIRYLRGCIGGFGEK